MSVDDENIVILYLSQYWVVCQDHKFITTSSYCSCSIKEMSSTCSQSIDINSVTGGVKVPVRMVINLALSRGPPCTIQIQDSKDFAKSLLRFKIQVKI